EPTWTHNRDDIAAYELNLYRVSVPDEGTTVNLTKVESKKLLKITSKISEAYGTALPKKTIHVIARLPSTGKGLALSSGRKPWIRQYERPVGIEQDQLVYTFGSGFPLLRREETLDVLWNGVPYYNGIFERFKNRNNRNKGLHPIPLLACEPGTGKSRFLREIGGMLREKVSSCSDQSIRSAFPNMVSINITYGSGTLASGSDVWIGGEASIAARLLYGYFISTDNFAKKAQLKPLLQKKGAERLTLNTTIEVIRTDIINRGTSTNGFSVLVINIDEVNHLHRGYPDTLRQAVHAVGALSCRTTEPFCIPIMASTIQGPVESMAMGSYRMLLLPLPLLTDADVVEIGLKLHLTIYDKIPPLTEDYLRNDILFRRSIADIGGMARAVEYFYLFFVFHLKKTKEIPGQAEELTECLRNVDIVVVMQQLVTELDTLYPFEEYEELMTPVLAKAILDMQGSPSRRLYAIAFTEQRRYCVFVFVLSNEMDQGTGFKRT
ncbi:hypothetical protein BX616_003852, partial [Lobosporangium transversale]